MIASQASLKIFSSFRIIFFLVSPIIIKSLIPIDQAKEAQVFLLTNFANLLSRTPSVSFGYISNNLFESTKPITLSPRNSSLSLLIS